jgi:hypothetical protein
MKKQHMVMLVLAALLAGLGGGIVSSQFLNVQPALAETSPRISAIVTAKAFQLVDDNGNVRALLGLRSMEGAGLWLYDTDGKALAALEVVEDGSGSVTLGNKEGKIIWSKP